MKMLNFSFLVIVVVSITRCSTKPPTQAITIFPADDHHDIIGVDHNNQHRITRRLAPFPQPQPQPKGGSGGNKSPLEDGEENTGHLSLKIEECQKLHVSTVTIVFTVVGIVIAFLILVGMIYYYWC